MCSKNNFYTINNVTKDSFIQTASMEENSQDFYRDFVVTRRARLDTERSAADARFY